MSASIVAPLVPPAALRGGDHVASVACGGARAFRRLPLASLVRLRITACVYGLSVLDARGRVADSAVMRALGWAAGLRLVIAETDGVITVEAGICGGSQVTAQGHLRLPALIRHRCGIGAGDRVLLVADPDRRQLVVYPPAAIDALISQQPFALAGGESA